MAQTWPIRAAKRPGSEAGRNNSKAPKEKKRARKGERMPLRDTHRGLCCGHPFLLELLELLWPRCHHQG